MNEIIYIYELRKWNMMNMIIAVVNATQEC